VTSFDLWFACDAILIAGTFWSSLRNCRVANTVAFARAEAIDKASSHFLVYLLLAVAPFSTQRHLSLSLCFVDAYLRFG
jgi:hypothetical protein